MTGLTIIKTEIYINHDNIDALLKVALRNGFPRDHPKRAWTPAEKKRALTFAVRSLVTEAISRHHVS